MMLGAELSTGSGMTNREVGISSVAELGEILRAVRKESGLTQKDAAALCNVSLPFLNGLERGKQTAQIGKVLSVCRRFGIEVRMRLPGDLDSYIAKRLEGTHKAK